MRTFGLTVAALAAVTIAATPAAAGDPERGERLYRQCMACHVPDQEQNRIGPHMVGLFGREAGAVEGFNYSSAMVDSGIVWDEESLDAFIEDPDGVVPGNTMQFAGVRSAEDRADIIAYLREATQAD